jgi:hypothetical protein
MTPTGVSTGLSLSLPFRTDRHVTHVRPAGALYPSLQMCCRCVCTCVSCRPNVRTSTVSPNTIIGVPACTGRIVTCRVEPSFSIYASAPRKFVANTLLYLRASLLPGHRLPRHGAARHSLWRGFQTPHFSAANAVDCAVAYCSVVGHIVAWQFVAGNQTASY